MEENNVLKNQDNAKDKKQSGFFKKDSKCEKLQAENSKMICSARVLILKIIAKMLRAEFRMHKIWARKRQFWR